jgi:hypothetical protein
MWVGSWALCPSLNPASAQGAGSGTRVTVYRWRPRRGAGGAATPSATEGRALVLPPTWELLLKVIRRK